LPEQQPRRTFSDASKGRQWEVDHRGQLARAHDNRTGVTIHRGIGEHRVVTERPDRSRVVSIGTRMGFVERPHASRAGFVTRTYVAGGRSYARVYHTQTYRGVVVQRYVPARVFQPTYYRWAATPWVQPVRYSWGWTRDPWYGYYRGYFAPAPYYPSAAFWLTDFVLAASLQSAYQNQVAAANGMPLPAQMMLDPSYPQSAVSPELKQALAAQVQLEIAAEQAAAAQPLMGDNAPPAALDPNLRLFVVASNMEIMTFEGQTCALTPGDIIIRNDTTIQDGNTVGVSVMSSKPGECPANSTTLLEIASLEEMHNQFREQLSAGLSALGEGQGAGGLPPGPAMGQVAFADGQAALDGSAVNELQQQQRDAQQMEADARNRSPG
jgi:hypothetical protein